MKEATAELNSTVIVVISIGVLMTFFFSYLWPMIHNNFKKQADCNRASCDCNKTTRDAHGGKCWCTIDDLEFECSYKG